MKTHKLLDEISTFLSFLLAEILAGKVPVPFKPNYVKLERDLGIHRNAVPDYLMYLENQQYGHCLYAV